MLKGSTNSYTPKTPEMAEREREGKLALRLYFRSEPGRQAELHSKTGILQSVLSKMANQETYTLNLDSAVLIEVATEGVLRAEVLCPTRAEVLGKFLQLREVGQEA